MDTDVTIDLRRRRMQAVAALLIAAAIALPRFFTHSPMRMGVALDAWWTGEPPVVERVVGPPTLGRLEVGDRLLTLNGESLTSHETMRKLQAKGIPRGPLELGIERAGAPMTVVLPPVRLSAWERLRLVIFPIVAIIAAPLVAFLLVWRRPDLSAAWTFLWFACLQGIGTMWEVFPHPMVESTGPFRAYLTGYTMLVWLYPASFLHFMTVFPRPRWTRENRWRSPWFWCVGAAYLAPLVMWLLYAPTGGPPNSLYGIYQAVVFPLAVISLIERYARKRPGAWQPRGSERVLAVLVGVLLFLVAAFSAVAQSPAMLSMIPPAPLRVVFSALTVSWLLAPLFIAYLIANDPAFDPRRVLVQSVPYALLTGVLAALYLGVVLVGQRMFQTWTGEETMAFNVVAAVIIAFLFAPLRERLQRVLDRVFGRDREVLRRAIDEAGQGLLGAADRAEVQRVIEGCLERGLKRAIAIDWPESGAPRLARGEEAPAEARAAIENLLSLTGIRLESLALQEERATAERRAVELREAAARAELRALHAQVQPHFLFNALNALSYLTETDPAAAQRFTERLADMLRYTVEASNRRAALLSEEIAFVEDYLGVARERYETPLSFVFDGPRELLSVAVPPLLLQPLVENSLKHGCAADAPALHMVLTVRESGGWLTLEFSDDGRSSGVEPPGLGVGLENLDQRVQRFSGPEAKMEAGPRPEGGFIVRLRWRMLRRVA
jgi:hypothetical protein